MKVSMVVLSVICLIGGLALLPRLNQWFIRPAAEVLSIGSGYAQAVLGAVK